VAHILGELPDNLLDINEGTVGGIREKFIED
jgi:hypothetical protein